MAIEVQIQNLLIQGLIDQFTATLQTPYADDEPTRVNVIAVGKLQENPFKYGNIILLQPSMEVEATVFGSQDSHPMANIPMSTIGSGLNFFYKRTVIIGVQAWFLSSPSFQDSLANMAVLFSRVSKSLFEMNHISTVDDFGERLLSTPPFVRKQWFEEGGAKSGKNFYRGELTVDWYTQLRV